MYSTSFNHTTISGNPGEDRVTKSRIGSAPDFGQITSSDKWYKSTLELSVLSKVSRDFGVIPREKKTDWDQYPYHQKHICSWSLELILHSFEVFTSTTKPPNMSSKLQLQICFWWYGYWSQPGFFFCRFRGDLTQNRELLLDPVVRGMGGKIC